MSNNEGASVACLSYCYVMCPMCGDNFDQTLVGYLLCESCPV